MIPIVIMAIEDESDRDYITGLFLKNERSMYAMALKIVKEHHTACDMVSEACLKMIEKIGYLREISVQKQTPYILSIVKNTSLMYLRQRRSENNWLVDDERILDYCLRIMENAKATEAQKLQKYNLAAEIKRKYEELQRVKKASDESVEKIRANRNYSREYREVRRRHPQQAEGRATADLQQRKRKDSPSRTGRRSRTSERGV